MVIAWFVETPIIICSLREESSESVCNSSRGRKKLDANGSSLSIHPAPRRFNFSAGRTQFLVHYICHNFNSRESILIQIWRHVFWDNSCCFSLLCLRVSAWAPTLSYVPLCLYFSRTDRPIFQIDCLIGRWEGERIPPGFAGICERPITTKYAQQLGKIVT